MRMRRALPNEAGALNRIAYESESIWGEDRSYMDMFSQNYCVTERMIEDDHVYIMEEEGAIIGFFAILKNEVVPELELFYIAQPHIGKGYGLLLWESMIGICRAEGIRKIELVGSQDVVGFYKKLGAKEIARIKSVLKEGRVVTRFEYEIS